MARPGGMIAFDTDETLVNHRIDFVAAETIGPTQRFRLVQAPGIEDPAGWYCGHCGNPTLVRRPMVNRGNDRAVMTGAVGAAIGGAIGGPPGALVGALLGLLVGSGQQGNR